jgi:hypothetical protein
MLQFTDLRKTLKLVIFLLIGVCLCGCYSLKTIPLNSVKSFPPKRNIVLIHADDSIWAVTKFLISENELTGQIYRDPVKITKLKGTHVYVAPLTAVKVEEMKLTVPGRNIGKADYFVLDWWKILGTFGIVLLVALTL